MHTLLRRLRRQGIPLEREAVEATRWTEGTLVMTRQHGGRCLAIHRTGANPEKPALAYLFAPVVAGVEVGALVLRGIERVDQTDGTVAAVVQEWAVRYATSLGPLGLLSPEAKPRGPDLPG